jgi:ankyrin repeat protein
MNKIAIIGTLVGIATIVTIWLVINFVNSSNADDDMTASVMKCDAVAVQQNIDDNADVNGYLFKGGAPYLSYAVTVSDCEEVVKILLHSPNIDVNIKTIDGKTPLQLAKAQPNNSNVIKMLLNAGAIDFSVDTAP